MKKYLLAILVGVLVSMSCTTVAKAATYYIKINKNTNVVTVYNEETKEPVKAFVCSVGNATPIGTFKTSDKYRWHLLVGPSYGQYCTRITGRILFHSVWYYRNMDYDSQSYVQYRRLGTTASHGCIRLTVADSRWIYFNCKAGTRVTIFKGKASDDPLGKPLAPEVTSGNRGWDPTDPNPDNPYLKMAPKLKLKYTKRIVETNVSYAKSNLRLGVVARRANGEYISPKTLIYVVEPGSGVKKQITAGKYVFEKPGTYKIYYKVHDPVNKKSATQIATFVAKDYGRPIIKKTLANKTIEVGTTTNFLWGVTAKTCDGSDYTSLIKVSVRVPGRSAYEPMPTGKYCFEKPGVYSIKYEVRNPKNGRLATVTVTRKVVSKLGEK